MVDGEIVAAAQEERFTRKKHDHAFPIHAIQYCLSAGGINESELDYVAFYDKPYLKFERLLETYIHYAPRGFRSFLQAMPLWLQQKLHLPREMRRHLRGAYKKRFVFARHHESHAASAFFPSPFEEAAILTIDGVGEWSTATWGVGQSNRITLHQEMRFPHSLGLLYSAFTYFCGFRVNSGEYKLMGLAPYGTPRYADLMREKLVDLKEDGSLALDMTYFNYCQGLTMTSRRMETLFGGPPRKPEAAITEREMDIAASVQQVTEEAMLRMVRYVHSKTKLDNLCLAGGVALNCVGNGRITREGPFKRIWIQPAAGDAGGALGIALFTSFQLLGQERRPQPNDAQHGSLLGPHFTDTEIGQYLDQIDAAYTLCESDDVLCQQVAELLDGGNVVGWMQGRMEFGPRALGARSILGDARSPTMQSKMNLKIKFRESFRPFAPAVLREHVAEYFDVESDFDSPYMLQVAPVHPRQVRRESMNEISRQVGLDKRKPVASTIPAVTHVDCSARIETVDEKSHPLFHALLRHFYVMTNCPVLINTSFNVRGEPIVCSPADAYRCFMATNMDALAIGRYVLRKADQPNSHAHPVDEYLAEFQLD